MKFYLVQDAAGSTLGCELTLKAAKALRSGGEREPGTITRITCDVNAETVRRLLGQLGGYATHIVEVKS